MFQTFKKLLKHSFVYSISNVAVKASGIILLPIYTNYFTVEEFGRLGLILAIIIILTQVVVLGQGQSILRFNNPKYSEWNVKSVLFSLLILVLIASLVFTLLAELTLYPLANLLGNIADYYSSLHIAIYIITVTVINNLFQNKLRADEKSVFYSMLNIIKLVVLMIVTIYLVAGKKIGINGVLIGYLCSEIAAFVIILPPMIKQMEIKLNFEVIKASLKFGIPLIISGLAVTLLSISDRFLIKFLASEAALGLYELGYRVAGILTMFFLMPLSLTLLPIAYKIYNQPGDKEYYKKIMTYVTFILMWGGLFLAVYSKEIISLFSSSDFFIPAYEVVPVILLSLVFLGMSMISSLGMYLVSKTIYVAVITVVSATINIGLNFLLIPVYGIMGAAINTLVASILLYFLSLIVSNHYYRINFENIKLLLLLTIGTALFFITYFVKIETLGINIIFKLIIVIAFPVILYLSSFYDSSEIRIVRGFIQKWRNPSDWLSNLKNESIDFFNKD
ncbi:MAG: oligosaccharide flippase family protein [Ignavibacteriaceae bacterium]